MPKPQLENGFIQIACGDPDNDILMALVKADLNGTEWEVVITVMRKTWGWHKKQDWISYSQFSKYSNKSRMSVYNSIKSLVKKSILVKKTVLGKSTTYLLNKDFSSWQLVKKTVLVHKPILVKKTIHTSKENCTGPVQKTVPTKDIYTKDTITKDNTTLFLEEFNKLFERNYKPTAGRIKKLELRLKSFSLEDILTATRNLAKSPFHRGVNDRGWTADPDFLIRNDEQIDKWLNVNMEEAKQLSRLNKEVTYGNKIAGFSQ